MGKKRLIKLIVSLWTLVFLNPGIAAGQLLINEVCAKNSNVIADFEGDFEDWIEILNRTPDSLNLEGYCLSDDRSDPHKWCFPAYVMAPGEHLLLFASGKDIALPPLYWHTIIDRGEDWAYIVPDAGTPVSWMDPGFDDSSWNVGPSGFGYGDDDDSTVIPAGTISVFMRKTFYLEDPSVVSQAVLHLDYDDAFVAYINGQEIARSGINGNPPAFNTEAFLGREATIYGGGKPLSFDPGDPRGVLVEGENLVAIQVHNLSSTSSDFSAIPFLSILTTAQPLTQTPEVLDLTDRHYHTSFKLDGDGYTLFFTDPSGITIDSLVTAFSGENHSWGRVEDGTGTWAIFTDATPGGPNHTEAFKGYVTENPIFSKAGGRFQSPFQLILSSEIPSDTVYYTLDGEDPDAGSAIYTEPIEIDADMVVRATILRSGFIPGRIITQTYFSGADHHLPVLAVSTEPYNLWDYYEGIYVAGPDAEADFPYFNANFWKDWERPAHIEFFDEEGNPGFSLDGGIKIYGGWTRGFPQKSMSIFARTEYGAGSIEYPLFGEDGPGEFESIVIRNSGNDWFGEGQESGTMFRDVLMSRLTGPMNLEHQAARQAVIYINGEYWGIQNIREKISEHFIAAHSGADPDRIDLLEGNMSVINGSSEHYQDLITFLETNDILRKENYDYVKTQMDIQNFICYQLSQIYYDNKDWPSNNIKYWRPDTPAGKWRWILYDTDFGFGLWNPGNVNYNTLKFALEPSGPSYPNPPWSTFMLRRLMKNQEFKEHFINSFADQINTSFRPEVVNEMIGQLRDAIDEEMFSHADRWGGSYQQWINRTNELKDFARLRPGAMQNFIMNTLYAGEKALLTLHISDPGAGSIQLNSIMIDEFPWSGIYFTGIPVVATAVSNTGYRFAGWTGTTVADAPRIRADLPQNATLIANFEIDPAHMNTPVMINEICYRQDTVPDPQDWLELYNNSDQYVNIAGWSLKDSDNSHSYTIKPGTLMNPYGYLVICRNRIAFETVFPTVTSIQGGFDFGFSSSGEVIRLFDQNGTMVDVVYYGDLPPWPYVPPGSNFTIVLLDPGTDNFLAESWGLSNEPYGTPGGNNSFGLSAASRNISRSADVLLQPSPNPFTDRTKLLFYSAMRQPVRLAVYELNGRLIEIIVDRILETGTHEFYWGADEEDEGIYIVRLETPGKVSSQKIVKIR